MDLEKLKYPVGKYEPPTQIAEDHLEEWMSTIEELPDKLEALVETLSYDNLDWTYRPEGWTIKQVVHHMADSHMNSFIRFKLSMTEESPTIKPYMEGRWSETPDANNEEISSSLAILKGLHKRMTLLFHSMSSADWKRTFYHPEYSNQLTLDWMLGLYAWHSNHHLTHIKQALAHEGTFTSGE